MCVVAVQQITLAIERQNNGLDDTADDKSVN
jgi:hypothetical protein